jgi:uncharacterized protein YndB with AHSA1/START domain
MHLLATATTVIARPRARVFACVTALTGFAQWFPGVAAVRACDDRPADAVGKQYEETLLMPMGRTRTVRLRVVEVVPGARFVTEGALPLLWPRMEIDFHDQGPDACRVQWTMRSRASTRLARWLVVPLARPSLQRRAEAGLRRLKARLEAQPLPPITPTRA